MCITAEPAGEGNLGNIESVPSSEVIVLIQGI